MSSVFTKAVLALGAYQSPDGVINVTPDRLRHWEKEVKRVQSAGYTIPMHWDHAELSDMDSLSPIRMDSQPRSAANTVGKLLDFQVAPDGKSAELTVETLTKSASEKAEKNAVFVSPVLLKEWKDGAGHSYADVIGSVDLVDYPVDHSQGPFVPVTMSTTKRLSCCLRMSNSPTKIYRLSENSPVDDIDEDKKVPSEEMPDTDSKPPMEEPPAEESTTSPMLSDVIANLAKMKIVLPSDTDTTNLLDRLNTALLTANAQNDLGGPEEVPEGSNTVVDPSVATMSLRMNQLESKLLEGEKNKLVDRLDSLLKTGRCSPAEHNAQLRALNATRMSLAKDNSVVTGDSGKWIESREVVPEGAFWDPSEKIKRLGSQPATAPTEWSTKDQPDIEAMKRQKREMLRT